MRWGGEREPGRYGELKLKNGLEPPSCARRLRGSLKEGLIAFKWLTIGTVAFATAGTIASTVGLSEQAALGVGFGGGGIVGVVGLARELRRFKS